MCTAAETIPAPSEANAAAPTPSPSAAPTAQPTAAPTAAATPDPQITAPPATAKPDAHGQAVVVIASGRAATVALYERVGTAWKKIVETKGCVGRAGVTSDKREGDKKTPKGVYALGFAFGTEMPETKLDFRKITDESYWVDDPESEYYNTWQEGYKGWGSAEKLSEYPRYYHYAVAIAYNTDCEPGRGSAIFLHCKVKSYTSGCVAVPESALLKILKALDQAKNPVIIIADSYKEAENYDILAFSDLHS